MFVDDFVIYAAAAVDNTAPSAPTSPSVTPGSGQIGVSWAAASGGVDNGGYMVVRGTVDPTTAPNVNGVYAVGNTVASGQSVVYVGTATSFTDTGLSNDTTYYYRVYTFDKAYNYSTALTTSGAPAVPSPTIAASGTLAAVNTTYGTASASPTSFTVSGSNLTGNLTVAPASSFEVSTTIGSGYTTSLTLTATSGSVASTTVYVRLAATATAGSSPYSGNITVSGGGATSQNVATASSTVSKKALTITAVAQTISYGTAAATVTGAGSYTPNGFANGDTSSVIVGTASYTTTYTATTAAGSNVATITPVTTSLTAANYSFTAANGNITVAAVVPSAPTIGTITPGNGQLSVPFTVPSSNGGSGITNYKYSLDGGSLVLVGSTSSPFIITGLTNGQSYAVRLYAVNTAGDGLASLVVNSTPQAPSSPTITVAPATFGSAFSTTYGTASSTQTFTVSGSTLSGDATVTAPTGLEISLSSGSGYAGSLVLAQTSGIVSSTTIYARLKATASAGNYNGQTFTVVSTEATTKDVATTANGNSVAAKALTLTGLTVSEQAYNGLTDATVTGTPVLTVGQVVGTDDVSLSGTASYSFSTATVGTSKAITTSGLSLSGTSSANYSLTLPSLSANITQAPVTMTGLTAANKNYDAGTSVSVTGTPAFSGLVNSESFTPSGSVTWAFADATVGTNKTLVRTGSYGAPSSNYSLTQPSLTANISAVVPATPTGIVITTAVVSGQLSVAFVAPANDGGSPITNYKYSTDAGSTWTAVSPAATTSPILISGLVNGTSYNVQIRAVNVVGDGTATASTAATPATPPVYQHDFGTATLSTKPYTATPVIFNSNLSTSSWTTSATGFGDFGGSSGKSLSLSDSSGTPTFTLTFNVASGYQLDLTGLSFWRVRSNTGAQNVSVTINGGTAIYSETVPTSGANTTTQTVSGKTGLTGTVTVVLTMSGATGTGTFRIDDFTLEGSISVIPPAITIDGGTSGTATAFTTTYGTASAQQSFTIAGSNLTADISVEAVTGLEYSINSGSTWGTTQTITRSGTSASATLLVRLAATVVVGGSYDSQAIHLSSTGATTRNIATASTGNIVSKATPTISVAPTASAITYGQTLASSELSGGTGSVAGTFAFTASSTAPIAGTASQNVTFTPTDGANYNTATTSASVTVNTKAITVTADAKSKAYGAADPGLTYAITSGALVVGDSLTGGLSRAAGENVGTYAISSTLANANYDVTFGPANLTITAATVASGDITLTPAGDGSYTASATGGVSFTYSYSGRNGTPYGPSSTAPTATGFFTVTASATGNYSGSNSADFSMTGPVGVADARTKSAGNAAQLIPVSELLGNDFRITNTSGATATGGLTVTAVTSGSGNTATLSGLFIQFTPSSASTDTFTYTVSDGSKTATGTVTITTETEAPAFTLQIVKVGTANFVGGNTTVTHDFIGVPNQTYLVEYKGDLAEAYWTSAGAQSTGSTGSFSVTFTKAGDHTTDWNGSMFFQARRQ